VLWTSEIYGYGRYTVSTSPPGLTLAGTMVSNGIRLDWEGPGLLESAPEAGGPYAEVATAAPGYIYSGPAPRFFRLRQP
jgi:hypothetical protein